MPLLMNYWLGLAELLSSLLLDIHTLALVFPSNYYFLFLFVVCRHAFCGERLANGTTIIIAAYMHETYMHCTFVCKILRRIIGFLVRPSTITDLSLSLLFILIRTNGIHIKNLSSHHSSVIISGWWREI